jgi:hypothetical protein
MNVTRLLYMGAVFFCRGAISMLHAGVARNVFVMAGLGVEALGLVLAVRAHLPVRAER